MCIPKTWLSIHISIYLNGNDGTALSLSNRAVYYQHHLSYSMLVKSYTILSNWLQEKASWLDIKILDFNLLTPRNWYLKVCLKKMYKVPWKKIIFEDLPRIRRTPVFEPIFEEKRCVLYASIYGKTNKYFPHEATIQLTSHIACPRIILQWPSQHTLDNESDSLCWQP